VAGILLAGFTAFAVALRAILRICEAPAEQSALFVLVSKQFCRSGGNTPCRLHRICGGTSCYASLSRSACGAICARVLASELADTLRLII